MYYIIVNDKLIVLCCNLFAVRRRTFVNETRSLYLFLSAKGKRTNSALLGQMGRSWARPGS
jgi:hypothetical protein